MAHSSLPMIYNKKSKKVKRNLKMSIKFNKN